MHTTTRRIERITINYLKISTTFWCHEIVACLRWRAQDVLLPYIITPIIQRLQFLNIVFVIFSKCGGAVRFVGLGCAVLVNP